MTKEEIKKCVTDLLSGTGRDGIEDLLLVMEENGFFEAPASSGGGKHSPEPGGLAKHSLMVSAFAVRLKAALGVADEEVPYDSLVLASLLHDLGKAGDYGKPLYEKNILKSGKQSDAKPWERNKELTNIPHAIRSVIIAERWLDLTEEEEYAIMYHDGLYDRETGGTAVLPGHETKFLLLLHWADMWASRMAEGTPMEDTWLGACQEAYRKTCEVKDICKKGE